MQCECLSCLQQPCALAYVHDLDHFGMSKANAIWQANRQAAGAVFLKHNIRNDFDDLTDIARLHRVRAVPTFVFFAGGSQVGAHCCIALPAAADSDCLALSLALDEPPPFWLGLPKSLLLADPWQNMPEHASH